MSDGLRVIESHPFDPDHSTTVLPMGRGDRILGVVESPRGSGRWHIDAVSHGRGRINRRLFAVPAGASTPAGVVVERDLLGWAYRSDGRVVWVFDYGEDG